MRTFIAIDLHPGDPVLQLTSRLKQELEDARIAWTNPDITHLTLYFLGDITPAQVEKVNANLAEIHTGKPEITIELHGLGTFGKNQQPSVLWAGIKPQEDLTRLWKMVFNAVVSSGLPASRESFRPHITLGRVKKAGPRQNIYLLADKYNDIPLGTFTFNNFILYQSTLTPSGPIYTPLNSFHLR